MAVVVVKSCVILFVNLFICICLFVVWVTTLPVDQMIRFMNPLPLVKDVEGSGRGNSLDELRKAMIIINVDTGHYI